MNPYLKRLDEQLLIDGSGVARGEIEARRAAYFARIGYFERARLLIASLRSEFNDGHDARVTILIIIAEAIIHHFEKLDLLALDRITRAQVLSKLINDHELLAIALAWRAHFEFDHSKFQKVFQSLQGAIDCADIENYDARARISNVLCKLALLCGDRSLARRHFLLGRDFALKESDQAGVEAMQHNKAAFRLSCLRAEMAIGNVDPVEVKETRVEIESARSLQNISGVFAFPHYIELCDARILTVERQFGPAIERLEKMKGMGPFPKGSLNMDSLDLEISYCHSCLGELDRAIEVLGMNRILDFSELDTDEKLVATWMQYQLSHIVSELGSGESIKLKYDEAVREYSEFVELIRLGLRALRLE